MSGVPHVMLIDKQGTIAFVGHPAVRKLEDDIDTLLKGESLKGEGTAPSTSDSGSENEDPTYKELDEEKIK